VIGDILFPDAAARATAHERWRHLWDETEPYWTANDARAAFVAAGLPRATFEPVSFCGGVLVVERD